MKAQIQFQGNDMNLELIPETLEEASLLVYMATNKTKETSKVYTKIGGKDLCTYIDVPLRKNPDTWIEQ